MSQNTVEKLIEVDIELLVSNRYQPRKNFEDEEITQLAASIKDVGLLAPPLVRRLENQDAFEIIAGERRVIACKKLGMNRIPVYISDLDLQHSAEAALIENIQRVDLNPIEIALSCKQLIEEFRLSQEALAEKLGKKRSTIANYLRLLHLPFEMQQALIEGRMQVAHAKTLLSEVDPEIRQKLFLRLVQEGLSVQKLEQLQRTSKTEDFEPLKEPNIYLVDIQERLQQQLGTRVEIRESKEGESLASTTIV